MADTMTTPGWYGKLPSLGDFASRRLPDEFIAPWDSWLQHCMAASRATLGERWLEIYLTSPIWRFGLMPGVLGSSAWAGVLIPSVDKVGRHFPLTLALELPEASTRDAANAIVGAHEWFAGLEQAALSALDVAASADAFDLRLAALAFPMAETVNRDDGAADALAAWWHDPGPRPHVVEVGSEAAVAGLLPPLARRVFDATCEGKSVWWSRTNETGSFEVNWVAGLPPEDYFAALLLGIQWRRPVSSPSPPLGAASG